MPFSDDRIRYEGQPVAIVLAESVEAAEAGRAAVVVDCERETPVLIGHGRREPAMGEDGSGATSTRRWPPRRSRIEQTYLQAPRHHHTMETSGTVARWDGGRLTLWDAVQASSTVIRRGEHRARPRRRGRARGGAAHRRRVRRQGLHLAARDPRGRRGPGGRPPGQAAPAAPGPVQQRGLPAVDGADDPARRDRRRRAARPRARGRQQHGPGRHARRAGHRGQQVAVRRAGPAAAPAGRAGQPERAHADAGAGRGTRVVGPGERHERAGRRRRPGPARRPAGQLRRGLARRRPAVVGQRPARGVRGGGPPLRLAHPARAAAPGRPVGDRARHGHLHDGQLPVSRRRAGSGCAATAPWSRPTCTTSGPACRPC